MLQEKEYERVGGIQTRKTDVRVIAATNKDLEKEIERGAFREDLYYRLCVVPILLPPLRERKEDIPLLVDHFLEKICDAENLPPKKVYAETLQTLQGYHWPGNVRQLENTIERAVILSGDRDTLYPTDFNLPKAEHPNTPAPHSTVSATNLDLQQTVQKLERTLIEQALRRARGNKSHAADILGMKRTTLTAKMKVLEAAAV